MSLLKLYKPLINDSFFDFHKDMDNFFSSSYRDSQVAMVESTDYGVRLLIPMPGFAREEIEIAVEDNLLKVKAKSETNPLSNEFSYSCSMGDYLERPDGVKLSNGILMIELESPAPSKKTRYLSIN